MNLPGVFTFFLLLADKTIKLWKISERDKRPEGYNLKEEDGRYKDPNTITSLRVSPPIRRFIFGDGDYPCRAWVCDAEPKIDKTFTRYSTWRQSNFVLLRQGMNTFILEWVKMCDKAETFILMVKCCQQFRESTVISRL